MKKKGILLNASRPSVVSCEPKNTQIIVMAAFGARLIGDKKLNTLTYTAVISKFIGGKYWDCFSFFLVHGLYDSGEAGANRITI